MVQELWQSHRCGRSYKGSASGENVCTATQTADLCRFNEYNSRSHPPLKLHTVVHMVHETGMRKIQPCGGARNGAAVFLVVGKGFWGELMGVRMR